ncbi:MAG TPA: hypothetical protein VFJ30_00130 [Phycisphaerae bacterium]|nr:hypothetical protein [Phycisphaerae bacterium]
MIWRLKFAVAVVMLSAPLAVKAGEVRVGRGVVLIQGFEGADVLAAREHVSYVSGVPEEAEVEVWDDALYGTRKVPHAGSGIVCRIVKDPHSQGSAALAATFTRPDRLLRVSLRNNINQGGADRPACNSLGVFDELRGDIHNPLKTAVTAEMTVLGGFAVTDRSRTFSLVRTLTLKPGWNTFSLTSQEASATFVDPHDAVCVEFRLPDPEGTTLTFDNLRMERETIGANTARHARCFDFGVPWFNWPGFTYGSVPWDEQRGYGFTAGRDLTHGGDLHVISDQLTRDGFKAPASFRVKLPNGAYHVVTRTGNYWAQRDGGRNIEIKAEGKRVYYRPKMTDREFLAFKFAHERTDHWKRDMDLWATYEDGTYFRQVEFDTEVADGTLDLEFLLPPSADGQGHGESVWNYLMIFPADKAGLIRPEIDWLNEKIRTIYNKVSHVPISRQFALYNREEVICPEEFLWPDIAAARRAALRPTAEQRQRGYVHFLRHQHDLVTPDSVPLPTEVGDALATFAAPGETAQFAVGIYPLADLKGVSAQITEWKGADGTVLPAADATEVRLASYRPITPVTSNHAECFHYVGPGVLIPPQPTDVPAGYPRRWWFSAAIPAGAKAGLYRADVELTREGKAVSKVAVTLRVLPFALEEPTGVTFAADHSQLQSFWPGERLAELAFYRRIGLNSIWYTGDRSQAAAMKELASRYGLGFEVAFERQVHNWRWPSDYREAAIRPLLERGEFVSFTPRHTGHREGRQIRFTHGFWLWRSGIRHRVIQSQPNANERVYYAHAGHAKFGPCCYRFPSVLQEGLILPSPTFYEVRDGIYDWRYIQTLEAAIAASKAGPAREEAQAYLAELKAAVDPNLDRYYFQRQRNFNHVGRYGLHEAVWPGRRYQVARWQLARQIAAVKGQPLPAPRLDKPPAGGKVILHAETFGPFWVDPSQNRYLHDDAEGTPRLQIETPAAPFGADWITVLAKLDRPCKTAWKAVLQDTQGKNLATEPVGMLKRWKTRWVLRTSHLPEGRYRLILLPADEAKEPQPPIGVEFEVVAPIG